MDAKAASSVGQLVSDDFIFEILVAEGDNPSMQRNELARLAEGEYLLFLDDDSIPDQNIFSAYAEALRLYPQAGVIGGPSLLKTEKNILGSLSAFFFSSWIGLGPFRSRYIPQGPIRQATERELILCNLLMRKELLIKNGGFQRNLYPNEENELLKRIKRRDPSVQMIYQPNALVHRRARASLVQFVRQLYSYGQGRSKHIHLLKEPGDIIFFLPTTVLFYLLLLPALLSVQFLFLGPLILYSLLVLLSVFSIKQKPTFLVAIVSPFFFLLGHLFYGLGFAIGLFKYLVIKRFFFRERKFSKLNVTALKKFTN